MIIVLYDRIVNVQLDNDEANHIFDLNKETLYCRVAIESTGNFVIYDLDAREYRQRTLNLAGRYFKFNRDRLGLGTLGYIALVWSYLPLERTDFTVPSRGTIDTTLTTIDGVKAIRSEPLNTIKLFRTGHKLVRSERPIQSEVPVKRHTIDVETLKESFQTEPVEQRVVGQVDSLDDLKKYATELNEVLAKNANLFVSIKDNRLILEEEIEILEEF